MKLPFLYLWTSWLAMLTAVAAADLYFDLESMGSYGENGSESNYEQLAKDSLLWGPYRSGNYLGIRPRIPHSLLSGLLWFNANSRMGYQSLRHLYEQGHNLGKANWVAFDPRLGGREVISDNDNHITLTIDFVKSENGKNWGVNIKCTPHTGYENAVTSFVWYSGLASEEFDELLNDMTPTGFLKLDNTKSPRGYETVHLSGFSNELGLFEMSINDGNDQVKNVHPTKGNFDREDLDTTVAHHVSLRVPNEHVWRAGDIFVSLLEDSVQDLVRELGEATKTIPFHQAFMIRDLQRYEGNLHLIQKTYLGSCEFDITFNEANADPSDTITEDNLRPRATSMLQKIEEKFSTHFPLSYSSESDKQFGKELLSGLLGGLSYFYGDHLVDRTTSLDDEDLEVNINGEVHLPKFVGQSEGPFELFTLVPSRPFFPRGFYWDEGFHLLPLLEYDSDLALEIFKSWVNLIDDQGWIAREQILGEEARRRVPSEFVVQSSAVVNPPTLLLAFTQLLENTIKNPLQQTFDEATGSSAQQTLGSTLIQNPALLANFTKEIYPKLKLHFDSFRESQKGETNDFNRGGNKELYRWRGRTPTHSLASGLDDYPRVLPMDIAELNVDLLCWVGVMTRSMKRIAEVLQIPEDIDLYTAIEEQIIRNIEEVHWSELDKAYCDVSVDDSDEPLFACFKGYISLFPFLTKFIPPSSVDKLEHIINLLTDPEELWTEFGIRSLSKADEYYRTAENYWRSPIWININYLILESMLYYQDASEAYSSEQLKSKIDEAYVRLRKNLISNVKSEWERTGFVWEQYDDENGTAKGAKNFMGWSSLVLLIMSMPENTL